MRHAQRQLRREQTAKEFSKLPRAGKEIAEFTSGKKHDIERSVAHVRRITEVVDADDAELRFAAYNSFSGFKFSADARRGNQNERASRNKNPKRQSMSICA